MIASAQDKTRAYRFADAPRLDLSARQDDGSLKAAGQLDFNIGDFVDVLVGLEVTKTGRRVQVHLFLSGITQLLSAERIEMAVSTTRIVPAAFTEIKRLRSSLDRRDHASSTAFFAPQASSTVGTDSGRFHCRVCGERICHPGANGGRRRPRLHVWV